MTKGTRIVVSQPTLRLPTVNGGQIVVEHLEPGVEREIPWRNQVLTVVYEPANQSQTVLTEDYAEQVQRRLRQVLLEQFGLVQHQALATALAYELTSIIAASTHHAALADILMRDITTTMQRQLDTFGVGRAHP